MRKKLSALVYRFIRWLVALCYRAPEQRGTEHIPAEAAILVGNHTQMNGPIVAELYIPGEPYIWCAGQMMHWNECPAYAYQDFWSQKPKWTHGFYKLLAYVITPLAVNIFNNARTIPVYHDTRLVATFRQTMNRLDEGHSIVIFPEKDEPFNHILCQFQDKFVDTARMYYRRSHRALDFVPMYLAPKLHLVVYGQPVRFDPEAPIAEERARICSCLQAEITRMAEALPEHTVIPYRNMPKKNYPKNRREEVPKS